MVEVLLLACPCGSQAGHQIIAAEGVGMAQTCFLVLELFNGQDRRLLLRGEFLEKLLSRGGDRLTAARRRQALVYGCGTRNPGH